ncbi:hypothetical protein BDV09DRAFT_185335 [Aspergillus tetrazonus]
MPANPLPLLSLDRSLPSAESVRTALCRFGAFRLAAPGSTWLIRDEIFWDAQAFFRQPVIDKKEVKGYSPFASEKVQGKTAFPKESVYFFRDGTKPYNSDFYHSVEFLHKEWTPIRLHLLTSISKLLEPSIPLTGTALLDSATDSGTLTILFRSHVENDGLEIADLDSTEETDSDTVGRDATFIPIPTASDDVPEVIVFAGLRLQRMLGSERVRACVHRVRGPGWRDYDSCGLQ